MSELMNCPSCAAVLRLPPNVAMIRCPKCKLLLEVEDEEPPAGPSPSANAASTAPQLAKPKKTVRRPRVIDEAAEAEDLAMETAKKKAMAKKELRAELEKLDQAEDVEEERYQEIVEQCDWGQKSLLCLMIGVYCYGGGVFLASAGIAPVVMNFWVAPAVILGYLLSGLGTLCLLVGFGLAFRGPSMAYFPAGMGLAACVLQLLFAGASVGDIAKGMTKLQDGTHGLADGYSNFDSMYPVLGPTTNFVLLVDTPARLLKSLPIPYLSILAAVFEFCRFIFVAQVVQYYAELAKHDQTAAEPSKVLSRLFWVLLLTSMFRVAVTMGFDSQPPGETAWWIGQVAHGALVAVLYFMMALQLLKMGFAIRDTRELFYAERVASKHDRLDAV